MACKLCRQRTAIDYSKKSNDNIHVSYSDLQSEQELIKSKKNSQNLGDRLGLDAEVIVNVRRLQPTLCQRCYRYRLPITRTHANGIFIILDILLYNTLVVFIIIAFILPPTVSISCDECINDDNYINNTDIKILMILVFIYVCICVKLTIYVIY